MKRIGILVTLLMMMALSGCGANKLVRTQDFNERMTHVKKIGIVVSDVSVQEVSFGGSRQIKPEESAKAMNIVEKTAVDSTKKRDFEAKLISIDNNMRNITTTFNKIQQQELYRMLSAKDSKPISTDFLTTANKADVDAFLLFRGVAKEASTGRKVAKVALALFGAYNDQEMTYSDISIVDKNGQLLYYNSLTTGKSLDDEDDAKKIMESLLENFSIEKVSSVRLDNCMKE